jgi:hypothetical protein
MSRRPKPTTPIELWPSLAQQHADALAHLLREGAGAVTTEVIVHVRGDGATLDDGTALPMSVVERIAPEAFIRALIHDDTTGGSRRERGASVALRMLRL